MTWFIRKAVPVAIMLALGAIMARGSAPLTQSLRVTDSVSDTRPIRQAPTKCFGRPATIRGTQQTDVLRGSQGADVILASKGDDWVFGRGGNDRLCGGAGTDVVDGGPEDYDRLHGGRGHDLCTNAEVSRNCEQ